MINNSPSELNAFAKEFQVTPHQIEQFTHYMSLLQKASSEINITTIIEENDIINYHFWDSLIITKFLDFNSIKYCSDIGTGGGFPGIPLKIAYPDLGMILIEVTEKKIRFLENVIQVLGLKNIEICALDWRTFLRKTSYPIDIFLSRASLHPDELLNVFKPVSVYKDTTVIYWASKQWQPTNKEKPFIIREEKYTVGNKQRRLIFFKNK